MVIDFAGKSCITLEECTSIGGEDLLTEAESVGVGLDSSDSY